MAGKRTPRKNAKRSQAVANRKSTKAFSAKPENVDQESHSIKLEVSTVAEDIQQYNKVLDEMFPNTSYDLACEENQYPWAVYWAENDGGIYVTVMKALTPDAESTITELETTVPSIKNHLALLTLMPRDSVEEAAELLTSLNFVGAAADIMTDAYKKLGGLCVATVGWNEFEEYARNAIVHLNAVSSVA